MCKLLHRLLRVRVSVAFRGRFPGITVAYQDVEDKPNGSSVESGSGSWFAVSLRYCTVGQIKGQLAKIQIH